MIDRNSRGLLAAVYAACIVAAALVVLFVKAHCIAWPLLVLIVWICAWQTFFFWIPSRKRAGGVNSVTSVADGKVVILEKVFERECLNKECLQISVYMNFFDVHGNFWPCDGEVTHYEYHPGAHVLAFNPKSSLKNEHTCVCMRTASGKELLFKQLAGGFARRIVCYAEKNPVAKAGEQCGIIKFGSRIDMFLPLDADVKVSLGDEVKACETILAEL